METTWVLSIDKRKRHEVYNIYYIYHSILKKEKIISFAIRQKDLDIRLIFHGHTYMWNI